MRSDAGQPINEKLVLLLVEDDRETRAIYSDYLRAMGYRVLAAGAAREGIRLALSVCPALIVMDLSLPRIDGYTAIQLLRHEPRVANVPVVAMTASSLDSDRRRAYDAGCDSFIEKPCTPHRLLDEIQRLLGIGSDRVTASSP